MKRKNYTAATLLIITVLLSSCGNKDKKKIADNLPAIEVKVNTVKEKGSRNMLSASGKIETVNSANLSTRMMGYVDKIYVQVGDNVRNGQLLLGINNAHISAKLAQVNAGILEAKAAFANAEKDFKRYTN
ncbi:MAG: efflux RND transporter periplasmic adaptor subunit, partial [Maribacter sp.]